MSAQLKMLMVATALTLATGNLEARDSGESMMLLKEAMMDSNADYNKHKKKANYEEFDRVEQWGHRNAGTIVIDGKEASLSDLNEYRVLRDHSTREDRETAAVRLED